VPANAAIGAHRALASLGIKIRWFGPGRERLRFEDALDASGFGAGVGDAVLLAVEADDEHGAAVHVAARLVGAHFGRQVALGIDIADALAETASAEFFGTAEEVDRIIGTVGGDAGLHGAEMLVTKRKDVRPHA